MLSKITYQYDKLSKIILTKNNEIRCQNESKKYSRLLSDTLNQILPQNQDDIKISGNKEF